MAKLSRKSKAPDKRPARAKYWRERTLESRKVRRIMRSSGMTFKEATAHWATARGNRRTPWGAGK